MNEIAMQDERISNELSKVIRKINECYEERTEYLHTLGTYRVKPGKGKKLFDLKRRKKELEAASDALRLV